MSSLSGPSSKRIVNGVVLAISSPTRLSCDVDTLHVPLICYRPPSRNMPRRSSPKAISVSLLSDAIAVSYASGTILSIVAETRPVDASITFAIFVLVAPTDFVQIEDYIVVFVQFKTINAIS